MCSILGFRYVDVAESVITRQNVEFYKVSVTSQESLPPSDARKNISSSRDAVTSVSPASSYIFELHHG